MAQDVFKGRRTEIEYLNGYAARRGEEVGIAAPANLAMTGLIHQMESGDLEPAVENIERL